MKPKRREARYTMDEIALALAPGVMGLWDDWVAFKRRLRRIARRREKE